MEMEEALASIYQEIYQTVFATIPEVWDRAVLYAHITDSAGTAFLYYCPQGTTIPMYFGLSPQFNIGLKEWSRRMSDLHDIFARLRQVFLDHGQEPWTNLTLWLDYTGKLKIDYDYTNIPDRDPTSERIIWAYEILGIAPESDFEKKILDEYLQQKAQSQTTEGQPVSASPPNPEKGEEPMPQTPFDTLLSDAVVLAFDKQLRFGEIIGNANWQINLQQGTITFGKVGSFPIQVIGTESQSDDTWLWGWANTASGIPDTLLHDAHQLQAFGQQSAINELVAASSPLTVTFNGHTIAAIASMVCQADAYYQCPYAGGALFVTIHQPGLFHQEAHPVQRIKQLFPQVIAKYPLLNHRRAFVSYLRYYQLSVEEAENEVRSTDMMGEKLTATFDTIGKLTQLV